MNNANQPINPIEDSTDYWSNGITKREYFAGLALQGLLANWDNSDRDTMYLVWKSTIYADALLKELEKSE